MVATRDIAKGERLYYDYNGHEYDYPTGLSPIIQQDHRIILVLHTNTAAINFILI